MTRRQACAGLEPLGAGPAGLPFGCAVADAVATVTIKAPSPTSIETTTTGQAAAAGATRAAPRFTG